MTSNIGLIGKMTPFTLNFKFFMTSFNLNLTKNNLNCKIYKFLRIYIQRKDCYRSNKSKQIDYQIKN